MQYCRHDVQEPVVLIDASGATGCSGTGGVLISASGATGCSGTGGVLIGASGATE